MFIYIVGLYLGLCRSIQHFLKVNKSIFKLDLKIFVKILNNSKSWFKLHQGHLLLVIKVFPTIKNTILKRFGTFRTNFILYLCVVVYLNAIAVKFVHQVFFKFGYIRFVTINKSRSSATIV